jgi:hypothetical protein
VAGVALFGEVTQDSWDLFDSALMVNPSGNGQGPRQSADMAGAVLSWLEGLPVHASEISILALEWPQVYPVSKGDPNDLFCLAGVGSALAMALLAKADPKIIYYKPREWKGTAPKEVMGARILERLTPEERPLIPDVGSLTHNIIDAVGIGLFAVGRLNPKRVFAR